MGPWSNIGSANLCVTRAHIDDKTWCIFNCMLCAVINAPSSLARKQKKANAYYYEFNFVFAAKTMNMLYNKIENNMGVGISAAVLTGEVREAKQSTFNPLEKVPVSYCVLSIFYFCFIIKSQTTFAIKVQIVGYRFGTVCKCKV